MSKHENDKHPFSSDRPILRRENDLLGRAPFAERLAEAISKWREKDSLILAVHGRWGDGKSSVKNMVLEVLHDQEKERRPQVIEFNPWQWQNEKPIAEAFFEEVGNLLGHFSERKQAQSAYEDWQEYAARLQLADAVFSPVLSVTRLLFGAMGLVAIVAAIQPLDWSWLRWFIGIIGLVLFSLALTTQVMDKICGAMTRLAELRFTRSKKTLSQLKESLSASLTALKTPIVVVIDDLDRLQKPEIQSVFQIIKANGDFPNFIYLLFFQRDIIEKSLNEGDIYAGSEYLEKIIQVGFSLPQISHDQIHNVLATQIEAQLQAEDLLKSFDMDRWRGVFPSGLRHYFNNLRDVNRFLSTLSFQLGLLRVDGTFQVDPVDLIALEVIRQFDSSVYDGIYGNKDLFTSGSPDRDANKDAKAKVIKDIIAAAKNPQAAQEIILNLFDNIKWALKGNYSTSIDDKDFRELRLCHPNMFERYFQLRLPEGDISQAEFEKAISLSGDRESFGIFLKELHRRGILPKFMSQFEAYKQTVDLKNAVPFITALFDIGDVLGGDSGFLMISDMMHVQRIIHWFLQTEPDNEKRKQYVTAALKATSGLTLPIKWIRGEIHNDKSKYPDTHTFDDSDFDALKTLGRDIILRAEADGRLRASNHLLQILFGWMDCDDLDKVKNWVKTLITTDGGLMVFLGALLQKSYGASGNKSWVNYYVSPEVVTYFMQFDTLAQRVKKLDRDQLDPDGQTVFDAVLRAEDRLAHPEKYSDWRK